MKILARAISSMSSSNAIQAVASLSATSPPPGVSTALINGANAEYASASHLQTPTNGDSKNEVTLKRPVSGLIGVLKPTGQTSMSMLCTIKPLLAQSKYFQIPDNIDDLSRNPNFKQKKKRRRNFNRYTDGNGYIAPKIGQGGTLDPLADGVLVLGIEAGTKRLGDYLDCTKEYRTTGLLGSSTLSYDADDPILHRKSFDHVNADMIRESLSSFRGKIQQMPPLYSAIRIDGKKLYDYAREGIDLPRPVEKRNVEVTYMELEDWKDGTEHEYKEPQKECDEEERKVALRARKLAGLDDPAEESDATAESLSNKADGASKSAAAPPTFTLRMTVSSGTYVRSIVHDVGAHVKSAAHVVKLSRTRQGNWISPDYLFKDDDDKKKLKMAIDWNILQDAADQLASKGKRQKVEGNESADTRIEGEEPEIEDEGPAEWEKILLQHMEIIEV